MDDPISPARRTLLKAGAATLATPVAAAIAQPAAAVGHQEAKSFDLWVISDQHVGTDKAASEGIQHGLVGFRPPPVRAESLATALRQSEEGGAFGGLSFNWDIALNLGDYAGFWDAPEDEQGREVVRQYSVLKKHRREQVYKSPATTTPRRMDTPRTRARRPTGGSANGATRSGSTRRPRASILTSVLTRSTAPGSATPSRSAISAC